jgi:hypothetical protein
VIKGKPNSTVRDKIQRFKTSKRKSPYGAPFMPASSVTPCHFNAHSCEFFRLHIPLLVFAARDIERRANKLTRGAIVDKVSLPFDPVFIAQGKLLLYRCL